MDTVQNIDGEIKKDFNDSGVQDVGKHAEMEDRPPELLDLSDDVLLCILKYCSPMDLKALGYTCQRLGRLIRDRTLWTHVDARDHRTGRARLRWLLAHALGANTVELKLQGYAIAARGCYGHTNRNFRDLEEEQAVQKKLQENREATSSSSAAGRSQDGPVHLIQEVEPLARLQRLYSQTRYAGLPTWSESLSSGAPDGPDGSCPGPQFTLSRCSLRQLRTRTSLAHLALDYCNIDCAATGISLFPPTLKRLSLKGTKCYNLPLDKSFLFNIQDYLPELEYIDLSECEWLEPASLLPLSKLTHLMHLIMRDCVRLSEFVAYASLATRYGFKKLEVLDVRGSPVGDSEVSAFGWLGALRELYVAPAPVYRRPDDHSHCTDEPLPPYTELEPWELDEPEYFRIKPQTTEAPKSPANMTAEEAERQREYENNLCLHGIEYNLCSDADLNKPRSPLKRPSESSQDSTPEHTSQELSDAQTSQVIEVYLRGRVVNQEPRQHEVTSKDAGTSTNEAGEGHFKKDAGTSTNEADEGSSIAGCSKDGAPSNEPEVLSKPKMNEETTSKDASTFTNEAGEGSSIAGCSKDGAPSNEPEVLFKRKMTEEATSKDAGTFTNEAGEGSSIAGCSKDVAPSNEPEVLFKRKMTEEATSKDAGTSSNEAGEGSSIAGCSKDGAPSNEPEVLPKRKKMNDEASSKDAGTSTNEADEGSSIAGCSKDGASIQITDDGDKNEDDETSVLNIGPLKRKRLEEAPDDGSNTCEAGPSKKLKNGTSNGPDAKAECSKDNTNEKSGTSNGTDEKPGCSKDVSDKSDDVPPKSQNGFNGGTSKDSGEETDSAVCIRPDEHPKGCKCKSFQKYSYVRFRQNMDPVIVQRDPEEVEREEREREEREREERDNENENREVRPRAHVLYVNVGQQLHTVYRLSIHNEPPIFYSFAGNNHMQMRPNNMFHSNYSTPPLHLDGASLVSDSAVRRFGRADVTDENVVHIGPRGPGDQGSRPNRSSLRILSMTGYRNITDRSLMHLVTAAPELRFIDFSNTRVTAQGVENFRSLRPDCEVVFSEFVEKKE